MPNKRGVVIGEAHWANNGQAFISTLCDESLRKYLLFWDEIDLPVSEMTVHRPNEQELSYLEDLGVLKRSIIPDNYDRNIVIKPEDQILQKNGTVTGKYTIPAYFNSHALSSAYKINSQAEPGKWSMAQLGDMPCLDDTKNQPGLIFDLYNMLPVPSSVVSLSDLLEFKQSRFDELLALRGHLDEVYTKITNANDLPHAKIVEFDRLENSLRNISVTMNESGIQFVVRNLRSKIAGNFDSLFTSATAIGAASLTSKFDMPPVIAGVAAASIFLACKSIVTPKTVDITTPFLYLEHAQSELI